MSIIWNALNNYYACVCVRARAHFCHKLVKFGESVFVVALFLRGFGFDFCFWRQWLLLLMLLWRQKYIIQGLFWFKKKSQPVNKIPFCLDHKTKYIEVIVEYQIIKIHLSYCAAATAATSFCFASFFSSNLLIFFIAFVFL